MCCYINGNIFELSEEGELEAANIYLSLLLRTQAFWTPFCHHWFSLSVGQNKRFVQSMWVKCTLPRGWLGNSGGAWEAWGSWIKLGRWAASKEFHVETKDCISECAGSGVRRSDSILAPQGDAEGQLFLTGGNLCCSVSCCPTSACVLHSCL